MSTLHFLDYFFIIFHTLLILFNLFGWIYKPLRIYNLITLGITAISWFVLGIFYGMGYCFLTDWHWEVLNQIDAYPIQNSYVQYLFERLLNTYISVELADNITLFGFLSAIIFSLIFNIKDFIMKGKSNK